MRIWPKQIEQLYNCFLALALFCLPTLAWSCECLPVASAREALKSSTLVFEGEVLKLQRFSLEKIDQDYKEFAVKFRRIKSWKGQDDNFFIIRTPAEKEHCGFDFQVGQSYVVYAVGGPIPTVTRCSRTALSSSQSAKNDIRTFGVSR